MTHENNSGNAPKKSNKKKWFFIGLGLLATGTLTFFGIQYFKKNKEETEDASAADFQMPKTSAKPASKPAAKTAPKPKPAPKTAAKPLVPVTSSKKAPTKNPAPTKVPTASSSPKPAPKPINAPALAKAIHYTVVKKDFTATFNLLRAIRNVKDYSAVSKVFATMPVSGVRQTLVTGLLNTFKTEAQRNALRKAFIAQGLKYDGKKWSLSGTAPAALIITKQSTKVWKNPKTSVEVPKNMVLGKEISKRGNFTLFESENQYFLVETGHVGLFQS